MIEYSQAQRIYVIFNNTRFEKLNDLSKLRDKKSKVLSHVSFLRTLLHPWNREKSSRTQRYRKV